MLPNTFQSERSPDEYERAFVKEIKVHQPASPDPRVERLIFFCWVLIVLKHVAVIWVVHRYQVPFHQLWVNAPTWILACLATAIYYWQKRRG